MARAFVVAIITHLLSAAVVDAVWMPLLPASLALVKTTQEMEMEMEMMMMTLATTFDFGWV